MTFNDMFFIWIFHRRSVVISISVYFASTTVCNVSEQSIYCLLMTVLFHVTEMTARLDISYLAPGYYEDCPFQRVSQISNDLNLHRQT